MVACLGTSIYDDSKAGNHFSVERQGSSKVISIQYCSRILLVN